MAAQTRVVDIFADRYTLVSDGFNTVKLVEGEAGVSRLHVGQSLPAPDTDAWLPVKSHDHWHFDGMGPLDRIFMRAEYPARDLVNAEKRRGGTDRDGHVRVLSK